MDSKYIVLRTAPSITTPVWGAHPSGIPAAINSSLQVSVVTIPRNQLQAVAAANGVHAVAPAMPMRLIEPVSKNEPQAAPAAGDIAWGIKAVRADSSPLTGSGVIVAVLDTGINKDHPAFRGIQVVERDFTGEGIDDKHGHGTHCAGTIFGRDVKNVRIGIARGIEKVLIGKVIGGKGGSSENIVDAILWAVDNGAHIISMSLGIDFAGAVAQMEKDKIPTTFAAARALEGYRANTRLFDTLSSLVEARGGFAHSTVIIAAAGNESRRDLNPDYEVSASPPAVANGIISVAALGQEPGGLKAAYFSNTDASVSAPGVDVLSADLKDGFQVMSGTSMATPHVAGVAALWAEYLLKHGSFNAFQLVGKLSGTATTAGLIDGYDPFDIGAGLVQAPQQV
jgi:subtilisin family serine protease